MFSAARGRTNEGASMSTEVELRAYADEAMRWARLAGNERDRSALTELVGRFNQFERN